VSVASATHARTRHHSVALGATRWSGGRSGGRALVSQSEERANDRAGRAHATSHHLPEAAQAHSGGPGVRITLSGGQAAEPLRNEPRKER
jgi:hypothetical protein